MSMNMPTGELTCTISNPKSQLVSSVSHSLIYNWLFSLLFQKHDSKCCPTACLQLTRYMCLAITFKAFLVCPILKSLYTSNPFGVRLLLSSCDSRNSPAVLWRQDTGTAWHQGKAASLTEKKKKKITNQSKFPFITAMGKLKVECNFFFLMCTLMADSS